MKRILVAMTSVALLGAAYSVRTLADPPVIVVPGGGPHGPAHGGGGYPPVIHVPGGGPSGPSWGGDGDDHPVYGDGDDYHPSNDCDGDYDGTTCTYVSQPLYVSCAPAVVDSNVQTADRVLADLSANELSGAAAFKSKVAAISAMPAGKAKTDAYFSLLGIQNPNNPSEILNFIYARQVDAKYVQAVSNNLQLSADQANLLINRLSTALKPRQ